MSLTVANLRRALEAGPLDLKPGESVTYIPRDQEWVVPPLQLTPALRRGYFDAAVCGLIAIGVLAALAAWSLGL